MTASATAHPRFAAALTRLGLDDIEIRAFPEATRTAAQAADAIGCKVNQIVKSLVFEADKDPVLVLMNGASLVDTDLVAAVLGAESVRRAPAEVVRSATGYAIGGIPPFGHVTGMRALADRGLLAHDTVWAAAGTPHTVFPLAPGALIAHAGAEIADVARIPG
ncbi:YbaK/EbsC family protein [Streptomyces sp. NBC_01803]|uniref:YbaK/EbsC family protein n=1 Tax=Streptomyces sp. NBC_01803 TaxID=2975946 RepID=UPI002DD9019E|nr:YbaK/EbsC family protein [Streptomyces sp. NBC_01803]WSA42924.1 YbaK/EbsC family protein [Streptomyces sp. NBC_01803]